MKKIRFLLILVSGLFFQHLSAQNCCDLPPRKKDNTFVLPKLIDTSLFISDLKTKVDLKSVCDGFKKDISVGVYMYTFHINEHGELQPGHYYDKKSDEMKKIQQFVETIFNHYKWEPGYKKKCISCKATIDLQLVIFLPTDENTVEVEVKDIETGKKIFNLIIPYKDLKHFN